MDYRLDVLGLHEFDSVRKRMSVVIRFPDNTIKVLVKGADTSMLSVLRNDSDGEESIKHTTQSHLCEYSMEGLRTLVVAARDLADSEFELWQSRYEDASTSLTERAVKLRQTAALIECDLKLLGATAIEDKLQDGVPEAIESLRQAGIKVWILTGDKQETAISIGLSCKLLTSDMLSIIINGNSENDCRQLLKDAIEKFGIASTQGGCQRQKLKNCENDCHDTPKTSSMPDFNEVNEKEEEGTDKQRALIIDGNSLVYILEKELESEARILLLPLRTFTNIILILYDLLMIVGIIPIFWQLFDLATSCDVVLCCRVAPLQKAGIVDLIKSRTDDMTLAIGDGKISRNIMEYTFLC